MQLAIRKNKEVEEHLVWIFAKVNNGKEALVGKENMKVLKILTNTLILVYFLHTLTCSLWYYED